ncbi:uncharacterized protein LOC119884795 [Micropterus salmoides]|uniref:uncharacterized protein LOC119884795 n=1 Tax=Micropterus salmoides TaxID=27706 RepID=UPI0018EB2FD8|nr:uncharacterized protein LOC119884795 [Micropterus salmoides]XP_038551038.1 uncharacterized protein LOC119884795 [Micropterus salmoides]XP_038551039.1 uncharacterized protein LOC119884795 [Micropterus salmoides]
MVIAQDHAAKEQNRHAQLYNKRVKGSKIDIGDRVLLANRKERGKKKLADRWESTLYTVVDMNAETHTYRVRDTITGQEKVIHRNLLMLANFLPVGDSSGLSDHDSSMSFAVSSAHTPDDVREAGETSSERVSRTLRTASDSLVDGSDRHSAVTVVEGQSPLTDAEPADSERRTIDWITQLSVPSQSDVADVTSVTCDPQDSPVLLEDDTTYDSSPVTAVDVLANTRQPNHNTVTQADNLSDPLHTTIQTLPMHSGDSRTLTQIRSRFGRLVRPVNRLIQTMSRQDVVQEKFDVKTACKSMFQAFAD